MEMSVGYYERVAMIGRPHDFQAGHEFGDRFGGQGHVDLGEGISVACWHCHQPVGLFCFVRQRVKSSRLLYIFY